MGRVAGFSAAGCFSYATKNTSALCFPASSFIWMVRDGMLLDPIRNKMLWGYLNNRMYPYRYRDIERLAAFQNRVFAKYAAMHGLPFLDVAGRFPHVSGLTFSFDPKKPKGSRVLSVTVGGKPLDPAAIYRLATNEYMMAGGDGYASLTKAKPVIDASGAALMATVVMDYIAAKGTVSPAVEGRITEQR